MTDAASQTFLYTHGLQGNLRFMPRLQTVLNRLRRDAEQVYTVDLGDACAPEVWHCAATGGRSMLIALDGMNYTAANALALQDEHRARLRHTLTMIKLIDDGAPAKRGRFAFVTDAHSAQADLRVLLHPTERTEIVDGVLHLGAVAPRHIGLVKISLTALDILEFRTVAVPEDTPPDPTTSGMVDFIEMEARLFQSRRSDGE
jgi:hypothetical protein